MYMQLFCHQFGLIMQEVITISLKNKLNYMDHKVFAPPAAKKVKYVYFFGGGSADGNETMKNLLGGKGANLAEMAGHPKLLLPVPAGFTITTEVCTYYYDNKKSYPKELGMQVEKAIEKMEKLTDKKFGDESNPLLVSVRSGARRSMPGMMETVLNVGLTQKNIKGIIAQSGNERFAYDAYRRLIMMYADVVMEKGTGVEVKSSRLNGHGKGIRKLLDESLSISNSCGVIPATLN